MKLANLVRTIVLSVVFFMSLAAAFGIVLVFMFLCVFTLVNFPRLYFLPLPIELLVFFICVLVSPFLGMTTIFLVFYPFIKLADVWVKR